MQKSWAVWELLAAIGINASYPIWRTIYGCKREDCDRFVEQGECIKLRPFDRTPAMATILTETLTLESTAEYLRLSPETILRQVENGHLPAQRNGDRWQFLRPDLDTWSDRYDQRKVLLKQAGALAHDDTIDEMQRLIDLRRQQSTLETIE